MISLIVPVYNGEKYLMDMAGSVFRQDYTDFQLIFSDDGSTDGTPELLRQLKEKDPRVLVVSGENLGVSAARNRALKLATGEYIGFCDSDDILEENYLSTLLSLLERSGADAAICGFTRIYEKTGKADHMPAGAGEDFQTDRNGFFQWLLRPDGYTTVVWNKLFRREALLDADGSLISFDPAYHIVEDGEYLFRSRVEKAVFTTRPLYRYTVRDSGAMYGKVNARKFTELPARKRIVDLCGDAAEEVQCLAKMKYQKGVRDLLFHAVIGGSYREIRHLIPQLSVYKKELFSSAFLSKKEKLKYRVYPWIIRLNLRRVGKFLMDKLSGH